MISLQLSGEQFPVSATFVHFLDALTGQSFLKNADEFQWGDQVTERMRVGQRNTPAFRKAVLEAGRGAWQTPIGRGMIERAYGIFLALLQGDARFLGNLQSRNRFIFVTSFPRSGGSYLTKGLFRAIGKTHDDFPAWFAHDGFPNGMDGWYTEDGMDLSPMVRTTIQQTAEWIAMADWYFREDGPKEGLRTIPKKATKMVYNGWFFRETFGPATEWVVPVRHPAAACRSLVDKAGGMTEHGLFPEHPRSTIEQWVLDAWKTDGISETEVARMPYFTAFLHYWKRYHQVLVTRGLASGNRRLRVLAYGREDFESYLQEQSARFASPLPVEPMHIGKSARETHPEWVREAEETLYRVRDLWADYGVRMPLDKIAGGAE